MSDRLSSLEGRFEEANFDDDDSSQLDDEGDDHVDAEVLSSSANAPHQQTTAASNSSNQARNLSRTRTLREDRHDIKHFLDKDGKVIPYVSFELLEKAVESNKEIFDKFIERLIELKSIDKHEKDDSQ